VMLHATRAEARSRVLPELERIVGELSPTGKSVPE